MEPSVRGAAGSGSQRLYSFRDILILKVVKRLLDAGISLQQIRTAVAHLRERGTDDLTRVTLMSDGASVYECTSNDEVIDLLQGGQGVFGIAIGGVWREIEGTLAELPQRAHRRAGPRRRPVTSSPPAAPPARPADPGPDPPVQPRGRPCTGRLRAFLPSPARLGGADIPCGRVAARGPRTGRRAPKGQFLPGTSQAPGPRWVGTLEVTRTDRGGGPATRPQGACVPDLTPTSASSAVEGLGEFVARHIGPDDAAVAHMLEALGHESLESLMTAAVPGRHPLGRGARPPGPPSTRRRRPARCAPSPRRTVRPRP